MIPFFKKNIVWIIIIFLLSSIFRLLFIDLIEFKSDEATTVYQTLQFFKHPYLIQRGLISGTGVYNFPLFNYLMIVVATWSRDPQFLSWLIALINSLLVGVFFLLVKKYYDLITAVFASLLLAFSPWGVIFSRKIWAQDLILLFMVPFFWALHELIFFKNTKAVLPMFILLALLVQLHGSGIFLSAVTISILLILRVRLSLKSAAAGILIGLIPSLPYFFFQLNSSPLCPDCESLLKYQNSFKGFDFNIFLRPFQIISGSGYHFVLGKNYADFVAIYPLVNLLKYVFVTGFFVIIMGIFIVFFQKRKYLFLVVYFVTVPFLYFISKTPAYMHYFVIIILMSVLLFAISIRSVYSLAHGRFLKTLILAYFLLFLISNITFLTFFYRFLDLKKNIEGDYGSIYSVTKSHIEKETKSYANLPYYDLLKSYAYIYAESDNLQTKLKGFQR